MIFPVDDHSRKRPLCLAPRVVASERVDCSQIVKAIFFPDFFTAKKQSIFLGSKEAKQRIISNDRFLRSEQISCILRIS